MLPRRADGALRLAACWAHLRCKFYELHVSGVSVMASETVERMAEPWKIEEHIRGQNPEDRRTARQEQSAAIVTDRWPFWEMELSRIFGREGLVGHQIIPSPSNHLSVVYTNARAGNSLSRTPRFLR